MNGNKSDVAAKLAVFCLCIATLAFFGTLERFQSGGRELLNNAEFDRAFDEWERSKSGVSIEVDNGPAVRLEALDDNVVVSIGQKVKGLHDAPFVQLSGSIKTDSVIPGKMDWQRARIILVAHNLNGEPMYRFPHVLVAQDGTEEWRRFSKVFEISKTAKFFRMEVQLPGATGWVWVRGLSLTAVTERPEYRICRKIAIVLWASAGIWIVFLSLSRNQLSWRYFLQAILIGVILVGTLIPEEYRARLVGVGLSSSEMASDARKLSSDHEPESIFIESESSGLNEFRIGHFLAFFLLSLVVLRTKMRSSLPECQIVFVILLAMASEILQFLVNGRNPQILDFFADVSGVFLGLGVLLGWASMCRFFRRRPEESR